MVTSWFLVDGLRIGYRIRLFLAVSSKNTDDVVAVSEEWNFHSITKSRIWRAIPRTVLLNSSRSEDARFVLDIRSGAVAKHQYASDAAVYRGNQVASFISS